VTPATYFHPSRRLSACVVDHAAACFQDRGQVWGEKSNLGGGMIFVFIVCLKQNFLGATLGEKCPPWLWTCLLSQECYTGSESAMIVKPHQ